MNERINEQFSRYEASKKKRIDKLRRELATMDDTFPSRKENIQLQIEETKNLNYFDWLIDQRQMEFDFS